MSCKKLTIRNVVHFLFRPSLVLAFLSFTAMQAKAVVYAPAIDQQFLAPAYFGAAVDYYQSWGQTFTVGMGGQLTQIDLQLSRSDGVTAPLDFEIRRLAGGLPDLTPAGLVYNTSIAIASVPMVGIADTYTTSVNLGSGAFAVAPGDQLAILLTSTGGSWFLWSNEYVVDGYAGGTALNRFPGDPNYSPANPAWGPIADAGFRTWVAVPEPNLIPAGLVAVAGWLVRRRNSGR